MNKKILITISIFCLLMMTLCSFTLAANNDMVNAKNAVMNAGNSVGNAVVSAKNAVVDGAKGITNGATTLGKDAANTTQNLGNDARNTAGAVAGSLDNNNNDYTASRTATNADSNLLGMSTTTWAWLILGIVGIVIVALVWYYGAQYEHRNYNND